jgi:hypothetical protein
MANQVNDLHRVSLVHHFPRRDSGWGAG